MSCCHEKRVMSQIQGCACAKTYLELSLRSWGFKGPTKHLHLPLFSVSEILQLRRMFYRNNYFAGKEPGTFPLDGGGREQKWEKAPELFITFTISDNLFSLQCCYNSQSIMYSLGSTSLCVALCLTTCPHVFSPQFCPHEITSPYANALPKHLGIWEFLLFLFLRPPLHLLIFGASPRIWTGVCLGQLRSVAAARSP